MSNAFLSYRAEAIENEEKDKTLEFDNEQERSEDSANWCGRDLVH